MRNYLKDRKNDDVFFEQQRDFIINNNNNNKAKKQFISSLIILKKHIQSTKKFQEQKQRDRIQIKSQQIKYKMTTVEQKSTLPQSRRKISMENQVEEYESSSEEEKYQVPEKNQISTAIYNRYHPNNKIDEVDEEEKDKESMVLTGSFEQIKALKNKGKKQKKEKKILARLKNLDTGEEEFIYEEQESDQEDIRSSRLTQGLSQINIDPEKIKKNWDNFWSEVQKNNEKLRYYSETGMYDEAEKILKDGKNGYPVQINYKSLDDWTPLHYACYEGHDDMTQLLLNNGANVNAITKFKRNSLHIATLRGYLSVVKVLYRYKIDCNTVDQDGNTALHFAAQGGYKDIIEYLLSIYCTLKKNKEGKTPIDDCCDEQLKQIFFKYGFKEKGEYEEFKDSQKMSKTYVKNKLQHMIVPRENLKPDDFYYYKLLGKGSFGEVFLVKKKNQTSGKLYAMKVLSKDKVATKNLQRYAITQRNVMSVINHPFMAKLFFAFQNSSKLFLVMDYYPGGDLGKLIAKKKNLSQDQARKYICELVLAFEALHKNMIVFRDLKPDNVVIDSEGHCRLTDFGLSKQGIYNNTTESFCGSVAYLAPEILSKQGHSRTVDWYLLGLVLYELIVGLPPYYNSKKEVLFQNIKRGPLKIPKSMSPNAKDLIKKLLCRDPRKRLGANKDSEQIKQHPFFEGINWEDVFNRKLQMTPIEEPKINFNEPIKVTFMENENGKKIEGWTFINKI